MASTSSEIKREGLGPPIILTIQSNEPRSKLVSFPVYKSPAGEPQQPQQPSYYQSIWQSIKDSALKCFVEQPLACCQSIWQSIKDYFYTCYLNFHGQCIGQYSSGESEDYFFDTRSQLLQPGSRNEENQSQNPDVEAGTSQVEEVRYVDPIANQNLYFVRSDSYEEFNEMWFCSRILWSLRLWGTRVEPKVAGTGDDGSAVVRTGAGGTGGTSAVAQTRARGTGDRSAVVRTGIRIGSPVARTGAGDRSPVAPTRTDDNAARRKDKGLATSEF